MAVGSVDRSMLLGNLSNVITISCIVNDRVRLMRPNYMGIKFHDDLDTSYYRYGFKILFPEIGKFIGDSGDDKAVDTDNNSGRSYVIYLHEKSGEQVIEFISTELGTFSFYAVIKGISVHDHASVTMGGPAYATYFTEQSQEPEE